MPTDERTVQTPDVSELTPDLAAVYVEEAIRESCLRSGWPAFALVSVTRQADVDRATGVVLADGTPQTIESRWFDGRPVDGTIRRVELTRAGNAIRVTAENWK